VTSRMSPGVVLVRVGMWYEPNAAGVDRAGTANMVLGMDLTTTDKCPPLVTSSVQVEKV